MRGIQRKFEPLSKRANSQSSSALRGMYPDHKYHAHEAEERRAHMLGNSLSVLRVWAHLGVRYITLTHSNHNGGSFAPVLPWSC